MLKITCDQCGSAGFVATKPEEHGDVLNRLALRAKGFHAQPSSPKECAPGELDKILKENAGYWAKTPAPTKQEAWNVLNAVNEELAKRCEVFQKERDQAINKSTLLNSMVDTQAGEIENLRNGLKRMSDARDLWKRDCEAAVSESNRRDEKWKTDCVTIIDRLNEFVREHSGPELKTIQHAADLIHDIHARYNTLKSERDRLRNIVESLRNMIGQGLHEIKTEARKAP